MEDNPGHLLIVQGRLELLAKTIQNFSFERAPLEALVDTASGSYELRDEHERLHELNVAINAMMYEGWGLFCTYYWRK